MWFGWLRRTPEGDWEQVCRAKSLTACTDLLLRKAAQLGVPRHHTIVTGSAEPRRPVARQVKPGRRMP
jgi:hypothetical protein